MLTNLYTWAARHNVSPHAMSELRALMGVDLPPVPDAAPRSDEDRGQRLIRLEAPKHKVHLWRNNVGAMRTDSGGFLRFGLANDTAAVNKQIKSSDLIGATPHVITSGDVGRQVAVFTAIEVKRLSWKFKGTPREQAQLAWINLILKIGGRAQFARTPKDIWPDETSPENT